jgi:L-malate glycosyltransferase
MPISILVLSDYSSIASTRPEAELFVGLRRAGMAVTVMTKPGAAYVPRLREEGLRVIEWLPERKWDRASVRRIRAELEAAGHDVMFLCSNTAIYSGVWAAVGLPVKVVAYRGFDGNLQWYDPSNYLKLLHPRIDAYWCNAASVRETVRRNLLFGKDRAATISKGHDVAWYAGVRPADRAALGVPADAFAVCFAANVRPMKGVPDLLRATWSVPPERTDLHLVFAGAGMDDPELRRLAAASPLRDRLHVLGPRRDALEVLAACDGFVLSSRNGESLTKSLMEAMSLGLPPVVTDVPGNRGIVVDGVCGRVVPVGAPAALGRALGELAADRGRARAWGAAAREQIRTRWSHAEALEKMRAFVERLAADAPAPDGAP